MRSGTRQDRRSREADPPSGTRHKRSLSIETETRGWRKSER